MNETNNIPAQEQEAPRLPVTVCDIQFKPGSKIYYFDPNGLTVKSGAHVVIDTAKGIEFGYCTAGNHRVRPEEVVQPLRKVLRLATEQDERVVAENTAKEKRAFEVCLEKIEEFKLDMQLVSAECSFDSNKILFFFTADDRVDFRELVKSLASVFHARIELRQIGVRDKARMVGGLGICGRPFCCAQFLDDFQPVSIKMAKTQNLSLNSAKISGTCGRLMCCLKYEQEAYEELLKTSPRSESFVDTPDGRGTVTDVNLMKQSVHVRMEDAPQEIHCYKNCDICVLRNGKAKKTDIPIPVDLAPLSGNKPKTPAPEPYQRFERRSPKPAAPIASTVSAEPEQPEKSREKPSRRRRTERSIPSEQKRPAMPKEPAEARKPERFAATEARKPERFAGADTKKPARNAAAEQKKPERSAAPEAKKPADGTPKPKNKNRRYYHRKPKSSNG